MDALYLHCASLHNQKKDNNKFKNKKQPELQKIKLYGIKDQGVKETVTQTSRRGGPGSWGIEDSQQGSNWRTRVHKASASRVDDPTLQADKPGGKTGERDRPSNPGFQHWEIKPQNL